MPPIYIAESEILATVKGFEECTTDKAAFRHREHLTVAVWYLQNQSPAAAKNKMRDGLLRFLEHHKVSRQKYHETLTVFWIEVTALQLEAMSPTDSLVEKCNRVILSLANKDYALEFYTAERLSLPEAKENFMKPDLKSWRSEPD